MTETPGALGPGAINGLGVTSTGVIAVGWDGPQELRMMFNDREYLTVGHQPTRRVAQCPAR